MKFFKKLLMVALTGVMSLSMLGSLAINAEEAATAEKVYKLSELMPMSKEEFVSISDDAEYIYKLTFNECKNAPGFSDIGFGMGMLCCFDYEDYKPYYTEKKLMEVLDTDFDKGVKLKIGSSMLFPQEGINPTVGVVPLLKEPIESDDYTVYYPQYSTIEMKSDEMILKIAKTEFCISQIIGLHYFNAPLGMIPAPLYGDANDDGKISISDAAFIAKKIAGRKKDDLTEAADINKDGKTNLKDCVYIAKIMNARHLAKAEGWF